MYSRNLWPYIILIILVSTDCCANYTWTYHQLAISISRGILDLGLQIPCQEEWIDSTETLIISLLLTVAISRHSVPPPFTSYQFILKRLNNRCSKRSDDWGSRVTLMNYTHAKNGILWKISENIIKVGSRLIGDIPRLIRLTIQNQFGDIVIKHKMRLR